MAHDNQEDPEDVSAAAPEPEPPAEPEPAPAVAGVIHLGEGVTLHDLRNEIVEGIRGLLPQAPPAEPPPAPAPAPTPTPPPAVQRFFLTKRRRRARRL